MTNISSRFIYDAGKKQNASALKTILRHSTIDIFQVGAYRYPAITKLAKEKNRDAVRFLLKHGAQKHYAVLGIAMTDDETWLNELLNDDKNLLDFAAQGAAMAKNQSLAAQLIKRGASPDAVMLGAASGNHWDWVKELYTNAPSPQLATRAAFAAAVNNDWGNMSHYQRLGGHLQTIAKGIGIAGHWHQGEKLIKENPQCPDLPSALAMGFAMGGHIEKAMRLHKQGVNINYILFAAAFRGEISTCRSLAKYPGASIDIAIMGAANGGHIAWSEAIRQKVVRNRETLSPTLNNQVAKLAAAGGFMHYARRVQGDNLTYHPSDTSQYAQFTDLLPDTFFCSHRCKAVTKTANTDSETDTSDSDSTFTLATSTSSTFTLA